MSEYKKVKIGDFLEQYRNTIWIDDSVEYGQITISSKDGVKFRCLKIGKEIGRKRQFVIDLKSHPNTVIFTRQGIADGSIGIAPSNVNGCIATENMPMFSVNENIILVEYLENLLISPVFKELVATITPSGSAQKSIHERDLLQLEITLPDLETQKEIVKKVSINLKNVETLTKEIESQKAYAKQLRQNILQDAIEGKLTTEWRKTHPVIKGNPDFDAEALFKEIQKQRVITNGVEKSKKKKEHAPIGDDEKAFEIPEGWKWVRLGEICEGFMYGTSDKSAASGKCPVLRMGNIQNGIINWEKLVYTNNDEEIQKYSIEKYDLLFNRTNSREMVGKTSIYDSDRKAIYAGYLVKFKAILSQPYYVNYVLNTPMHRDWCNQVKVDALGQSNINAEKLRNFVFPLPSLLEQKEIVEIVSKLLMKEELLEQQISQRVEYANQLMQSILKDAFEGR